MKVRVGGLDFIMVIFEVINGRGGWWFWLRGRRSCSRFFVCEGVYVYVYVLRFGFLVFV